MENQAERIELKPLYKFMRLLFKHRKSLIITNIVVILTSFTLIMSLPLWYKSTAIVVVQNDNNSSGLAAMLAQVAPFPTSLAGGDKVSQYMGFLQSQRLMDSIITKYNLQELYKKKTRFHTYQAVLSNLTLQDRQDGTFAISYMAKEDPQLAANIVNSFFNELNKLALEINRAKAVDYKDYLDMSYNQANDHLTSLLKAFQSFQDSTGIVNLEEQVKSSLQGLAELEAQRITNQIDLEYIRRTVEMNDPKITALEKKIEAIEKEINQYRSTNKYSNIPIVRIPASSVKYMSYYRNVEVQAKVVEYLALQLEQAKLEEKKQTAALYLVNPAKPADYKSEPKRLNILIATIFLYNIAFILFHGLKEYINSNKVQIRAAIKS